MNIFFWRKKIKKNNQDRVLAVLFFVLLPVIVINVFLYNANAKKKENLRINAVSQEVDNMAKVTENNNFVPEKQVNLAKTEEELDYKINLLLDDCEVRNQQKISGSIKNLKDGYMHVVFTGNSNPKKIKLTPNTIYIEVGLSGLLPRKEITYYDLSAGTSVFLVYASIKNEYGEQEPTALYVKKILLEQ